MTKTFHIIICALAALFLAAACQPDPAPVAQFSVTPETVSVEGDGGATVLKIVSSSDWVANASKSWVKLSASSGKASSEGAELGVSVAENPDKQPRSASVTIRNLDGESVTVSVSQAAAAEDVDPAVKGIATAEDLVDFAKRYNSGKSISRYMVEGAVTLLNDIDCSSIAEWTPVGTSTIPYAGTFNGAGHALYNVKWSCDLSKADNVGFIGYGKAVTIQNFTFGSEGDRVSVKGSNAGDATVGGLIGYASKTTIVKCVNNASIVVEGPLASGKSFNMGGIAGMADATCVIGEAAGSASVNNGNLTAPGGNCGALAGSFVGTATSFLNNGNVIVTGEGRAAGFVGYCTGKLTDCKNCGCIIAPTSSDGTMGPAWGCAYNYAAASFKTNIGYGHVGGLEYKDKPASAPAATFYNAIVSPKPSSKPFDTETTTVDWTSDDYYAWTVQDTKALADGVTYTKYICTGVPRKVCVLEIDLTSTKIELTTAYSDDIVPNPNANNNSNNGPKIRETLSQLCTRKRTEGQKVLAGINTGFFDSNDGYSRGPHIEEGEPVFVNNPDTRKGLPNHDWAFTTFTDGTASCGKKSFNGSTYGRAGTFKIGGQEFDYYTINETIVRTGSASYQANIYTYRYVKTPHPSQLPNVHNALATDTYYLVCKFTGDIMRVNQGYAAATVTAIHDGRNTPLSEGPYVTGKKEFVIQLSGDVAATVAGLASVGSEVQVRADMTVDGVAKPIYTQNSTMFEFMVNGEDKSQTAPATHTNITTYDPVTLATVSQDGKKVWLVEVDGRQDWVSMGLKSYEMYRIAKKLGGWNMTRFDGGGSSCMWVYDSAAGRGSLVSTPSDSKGERSCLNYIYIREK